MKRTLSFRKLINDIHLWMGLSSGLILFVVCLSGTVYTFRSEIERLAEPAKYYVQHTGTTQQLSTDSLAKIITQHTQAKLSSITVAADPSMTWQISVKKEKQSKTYFVDPYTGKITGEQGGAVSDFFTNVMKLHRWLLMDDSVGRVIVGSATIIFAFLILSGLILWFPVKLKNWRQGFKIKTKANWKRINHDLHNALGFYSFILLLIMSLTGLCWSFEWYKDGLSNVLGSKVFKGRGEKPMKSILTKDLKTTDYAVLVSQANELFQYKGTLRITMPDDSLSAIVITKNATGFFAVAGADKIQFDRFSGKPIKVDRFGDKALNVQIADSIKPLHTGEMFGTFSKILYFIACLIATSLPVTGTMIWLNKMKKKKRTSINSDREKVVEVIS
jgi:uncharacterized iron-regulated membrane protein